MPKTPSAIPLVLVSVAVFSMNQEARGAIRVIRSAPDDQIEITGPDYDNWKRTGIACIATSPGRCRCASSNGGHSEKQKRAVMIARPEGPCPGAARFNGPWHGPSGVGGFREIWTITVTGNSCQVAGEYWRNGNRAGGFTSSGCRILLNNSQLEFTQTLDAAMTKIGWASGTRVTADFSAADSLSCRWVTANGSNSGVCGPFDRGR